MNILSWRSFVSEQTVQTQIKFRIKLSFIGFRSTTSLSGATDNTFKNELLKIACEMIIKKCCCSLTGRNQYLARWVHGFVALCPGSQWFWFKTYQKADRGLKSHPAVLGTRRVVFYFTIPVVKTRNLWPFRILIKTNVSDYHSYW